MTKDPHKPHIPQPILPERRSEPLPWQIPKSDEEDPEAARPTGTGPELIEVLKNTEVL